MKEKNSQQRFTVIDGGRNKEYEENFLCKLIMRTETEEELAEFLRVKIGKLHVVSPEDKQ